MLINQNVLQLQISVNYAFGMHVVHRRKHLSKIVARDFRTKALFVHKPIELAALCFFER